MSFFFFKKIKAKNWKKKKNEYIPKSALVTFIYRLFFLFIFIRSDLPNYKWRFFSTPNKVEAPKLIIIRII
jgi:hypothetical protein